ncbi:MAG: SCO family protein [Pseudomonadota bacterium]|nr:SCO family protein [Pseudomonadota bacterium]
MTARIARNGPPGEPSFANRVPTGAARRPLAAGLLGVAMLLAGCGHSAPRSAPSDVGGPFRLTDQRGAPIDQHILQGKWTALYFGYTFCPDVCPTTLTTLAQAIDRLGPDAKRFQVVFITIDPERDTPEQLKTYLSSPAFPKGAIGLTGTPAEIAAVARAYHVYYKKAGDGPNYSMDHTSIVYLMDPSGHFSRPLAFGATPIDITRQIEAAMHGG